MMRHSALSWLLVVSSCAASACADEPMVYLGEQAEPDAGARSVGEAIREIYAECPEQFSIIPVRCDSDRIRYLTPCRAREAGVPSQELSFENCFPDSDTECAEQFASPPSRIRCDSEGRVYLTPCQAREEGVPSQELSFENCGISP